MIRAMNLPRSCRRIGLQRESVVATFVGVIALAPAIAVAGCSPSELSDQAIPEQGGDSGATLTSESPLDVSSEAKPTAAEHASDALATSPWFTDVAAEVGLTFTHDRGSFGAKHMPETLSGGAGFTDLDGDGWLDVYMVQSGPVVPGTDQRRKPNALFLNNADGTFRDATDGSGADDTGYGMGVCFGDIDNDGDTDMHVTNFGPDVLLKNAGNGTFTDVTDGSGIDSPAWGASCGFADYDRDGCLDLYVVNYVDFSVADGVVCGSRDQPAYCHPDAFDGVQDVLYHNRCDGTFEIVTGAAGVQNTDPKQGKGLGVIWLDYDDDGWSDIYVANDSTRNFLYHNEGDGTFSEAGLIRGGAFNAEGKTEAGMGIDAGDVNGDGLEELFVTHLDFETNTLYRNSEGGFFTDVTDAVGLGPPSLLKVGFGTHLFDFDNDRDLDAYVANGHIIDNIAQYNPSLAFELPDQLLINDGDGTFVDASDRAGPFFSQALVGRGTALGDYDEDGDLDLLMTNNGGPAVLLRNDVGQSTPALHLRLLTASGRDAIGARVRLIAGGTASVTHVRSARSYLAGSDPRLLLGLGGDSEAIESLEIRWPDGAEQVVPGEALRLGELNTIRQAVTDGS